MIDAEGVPARLEMSTGHLVGCRERSHGEWTLMSSATALAVSIGGIFYCPICGSLARDITSADFDGQSIRCPVDGDFDISSACAPILEELDGAERQHVLSRAIKARNGRRPSITAASFHANAPERSNE